ncbi:VWA domain-containing protein [Pelosinus sp. IPA-1]|uniref:vWA domain-containing protein n=1 Tax=Pelosinus sp. IPA-1 TaxID=3029569 RepID=UPI002552A852|nr:VWA domain-containing protein [Pelosinus sp. IPA-1]
MIKNKEHFFNPQFLHEIEPVLEELQHIFSMDMGARIGQTTVCSQKLHSFHPKMPERVHILQDIDAGQIFYQRTEPGGIYHIDIFHQCGLVDHYMVANEIQKVVEGYNKEHVVRQLGRGNAVMADFIDIQTSTGGGRVTGKLEYGKRAALRKAHSNHVHITAMIPPQHLACLICIVMAVENVILSCNLELRCNEKIENVRGLSKEKYDLSAYMDESDSLLQENKNNTIFEVDAKLGENEWINKSDKTEELKEFLEKDHSKNKDPKPAGGINSCRVPEILASEGMIQLAGNLLSIEEYGKGFKSYLETQLPEIEAHLRKVVREAKCLSKQLGKSKFLENSAGFYSEEKHICHGKTVKEYGGLAIAEMVNAAAQRMVENGDKTFKILHNDIRYFNNRKRRKIEFCLLIDASSSMDGQRIHIAKLLARYLFFSTNDRISVLVFQQNQAWVQVPFTHDFRQLEQSLEGIKAYGETPLALGLKACLEYIEQEKAKNPFIILITDGVPTLGTVTTNPINDALATAKKIKSSNYGFTCIGLKPHLFYLKQLAEVAGGSIYAIEDLDERGLC